MVLVRSLLLLVMLTTVASAYTWDWLTGGRDYLLRLIANSDTVFTTDSLGNLKVAGNATADTWKGHLLGKADSAVVADSAVIAANSYLLQTKDTTDLWDAKTLQGQDTGDLRAMFDSVDYAVMAESAKNSLDSTWADAFLTDMVVGTPTYTSIHDGWSQLNSSGLISGGGITPLDSWVIIGAAQFAIKTTDSENGALVFAETPICTLLMADSSINYIFVYYNSGTPRCTSTVTRTDISTNDEFTLGRCYRHGDDCDVMSIGTSLHNYQRRQNERLLARGNMEHMSGAALSEVATLQLAITSGVFYVGNDELVTSAWSSDTANFEHYYYDSASVWLEVAATGKIDSVRYNDGTGLGELTVNRYGVHWIYVCFGSELNVVYGGGNYVSLAIAETASAPGSLPDYLDKFAVLAGRVIIRKSASTFSDISVAWTDEFVPSHVSSHNDLGGLQGGTTDEYYHLTSAQHDSVTAGKILAANSKLLQGKDTTFAWPHATAADSALIAASAYVADSAAVAATAHAAAGAFTFAGGQGARFDSVQFSAVDTAKLYVWFANKRFVLQLEAP